MALAPKTVAEISLIGVVCDAVGGLYLAYDVFKRHAGPLGILTRGVTYGLVFFVPSWFAFGTAFSVVAGAGIGLLVSFDYWMLARRQRLQRSSPLHQPAWSGALRGVVLGLASIPMFGRRFGLAVAGCGGAFAALVYGAGLVPTFHATRGRRLTIPASQMKAAVFRALALGLGVAAAGFLIGDPALAERVAGRFGLLIGVVSCLVALLAPWMEFCIENASDSFFIYAGLLLLLCGLVCDTIPHMAVLLQ